MKVVINACFGGFGLSHAAYERLIEWGVPVRKYAQEERDPATGRYLPQPLNEGEVIFDRDLTPPEECVFAALYWKYRKPGENRASGIGARYWDCWTKENRTHPLLVRLVEEMGRDASGELSDLKVVEIPDGVDWYIEGYDGHEHIAERHRTWA